MTARDPLGFGHNVLYRRLHGLLHIKDALLCSVEVGWLAELEICCSGMWAVLESMGNIGARNIGQQNSESHCNSCLRR